VQERIKSNKPLTNEVINQLNLKLRAEAATKGKEAELAKARQEAALVSPPRIPRKKIEAVVTPPRAERISLSRIYSQLQVLINKLYAKYQSALVGLAANTAQAAEVRFKRDKEVTGLLFNTCARHGLNSLQMQQLCLNALTHYQALEDTTPMPGVDRVAEQARLYGMLNCRIGGEEINFYAYSVKAQIEVFIDDEWKTFARLIDQNKPFKMLALGDGVIAKKANSDGAYLPKLGKDYTVWRAALGILVKEDELPLLITRRVVPLEENAFACRALKELPALGTAICLGAGMSKAEAMSYFYRHLKRLVITNNETGEKKKVTLGAARLVDSYPQEVASAKQYKGMQVVQAQETVAALNAAELSNYLKTGVEPYRPPMCAASQVLVVDSLRRDSRSGADSVSSMRSLDSEKIEMPTVDTGRERADSDRSYGQASVVSVAVPPTPVKSVHEKTKVKTASPQVKVSQVGAFKPVVKGVVATVQSVGGAYSPPGITTA
jgi:hypothetical protein